MKVCLTIDMEEFNDSVIWKDVEKKIDIVEAWKKIKKFLEGFDIPATFFVLGTFAEKYPDIVKSIRDRGYEVGSHFQSHQNLYLLGDDEVRKGVRMSKKVLGKVKGFRAPMYSMHKGIAKILKDENFVYDSSVFPSIFYPHPSIRNVEKKLRIGSERIGAPYKIDGLLEIPLTVFPSYIGLPITGTTIRLYGGLISSLLKFYRKEVFVVNVHPFEFVGAPHVKGTPWWFSINSGQPFVDRLRSIIRNLKRMDTNFETMASVAGCGS